jgi:hypothetical protein
MGSALTAADRCGSRHPAPAPAPLPLRVVIVAVFGCGAFLTVIVPASRKVALRIDASGITLAGNPLRYQATTRVIPWNEVGGYLLNRVLAGAGRRQLPRPPVGVMRFIQGCESVGRAGGVKEPPGRWRRGSHGRLSRRFEEWATSPSCCW